MGTKLDCTPPLEFMSTDALMDELGRRFEQWIFVYSGSGRKPNTAYTNVRFQGSLTEVTGLVSFADYYVSRQMEGYVKSFDSDERPDT